MADGWFIFIFISVLEGSVIQASEQGLRKALYQTVRSFFRFLSRFAVLGLTTMMMADRFCVPRRLAIVRADIERRCVACFFSFYESGVGANVCP